MTLDATPKADYRWIIPLILENLGGRAPVSEVLKELADDCNFHKGDYELLSGDVPRWQVWARFVRQDLVMEGILKKTQDSGHGFWELA